MNREHPDYQVGFRKGRRTGDLVANICCIIEKAREFQKNIHFCFIDYASAFRMKVNVMKVKEESAKVGLKLNIQKTKIMTSGPCFMGNRWGNSGNSVRLYFFGLQNHCKW